MSNSEIILRDGKIIRRSLSETEIIGAHQLLRKAYKLESEYTTLPAFCPSICKIWSSGTYFMKSPKEGTLHIFMRIHWLPLIGYSMKKKPDTDTYKADWIPTVLEGTPTPEDTLLPKNLCWEPPADMELWFMVTYNYDKQINMASLLKPWIFWTKQGMPKAFCPNWIPNLWDRGESCPGIDWRINPLNREIDDPVLHASYAVNKFITSESNGDLSSGYKREPMSFDSLGNVLHPIMYPEIEVSHEPIITFQEWRMNNPSQPSIINNAPIKPTTVFHEISRSTN